MKRSHLLLGMIAFAIVVNADAMNERPAAYQILDSLVLKNKTYDEFGRPTYRDTSDWAAIFKMLDELKGVIDVNEYRFQSGDSLRPLLDAAVAEGNLLAVKELLEKYHANPNVELLEKKYNQTQYKNNGWTALSSACSKRDIPMIKLLLQFGANPNIRWASNNTSIVERLEKDKKELQGTRNLSAATKMERIKKIDEALNVLNQYGK